MVRLSGDGAVEIASKYSARVQKPVRLKTPGYTALYGWVYDADGDIDECVALVFVRPQLYRRGRGQLTCHGGLYLLQRTLRAAIDAGARPAEPGEFTKRAFVNGNLDLTGAEAVMDIIDANGRMAAKTALAAREGALYRKMRGVLDELTTAAANLSAFVDYPDDDIPELQPAALKEILQNARLALGGLLKNYDAGRVVREVSTP